MNNQNQNYLVIPLPNNFDESSLSQFSHKIEELLTSKHLYFVFDLSKIDILNSKLVGYLENIYNRLVAVEKKMVFVNVREEVQEILEFVGLLKIIEIFEAEEKFVKAIEHDEA